jgi:hypothetical protein
MLYYAAELASEGLWQLQRNLLKWDIKGSEENNEGLLMMRNRVAVVTGGIREYSLYDSRVKFYESYPEGQSHPSPTVPQVSTTKLRTI